MELSIIVPTFNERQNVPRLVALIEQALPHTNWELVFVDDNSPDQTAALVRDFAQADERIRCVHRYGRRGLASACVEGIMATSAPFVAVMDADLQHDESRLPVMLELLRKDDVDIVVGSRNVPGGGMGEFSRRRQAMSRLATRISQFATSTKLSDPMSGFFMLRRSAFLEALPRLSNIGFKILLDICASAPRPFRFREVPYEFRTRQFGESKVDALVLWEYALLLMDKRFGRYLPVRFMSFALIGVLGVLVHFAVLATVFKGLGASFAQADAVATLAAMSSNFFLNNLLTYSDRRLRGRKLVVGWVSFNLVCAAGAVANVGVASWLFRSDGWWMLCALAGIAIGVVWNYAMSSIFTWRND
ncbi:MAG: glycosyltransferase family 2 protein [Pseudomonadota bacterium]